MSFLKYSENQDIKTGNGRGSLSFSRANVDGMPFRGQSLPLREEEYNDFTEVVNDFDCGLFDIRDPKQYANLRDVFDKAVNGWYNIVDYDKRWSKDKDGQDTILIYVAWAVPHRELAKGRAQADLLPTAVPQFPTG